MAAKPKNKQQVKCRLKKGDQVVVIAGKCRGETGKIDRIDRKADRVYVTGLNTYKRHTRPNMSNQTGGIIDKVMPLHVSNLMLADKKDQASRIGYKVEAGKKSRFSKKSGTILA